MQPWLRNIGETAPFFHHPHSWPLHTCQAPTTGHCFRLSLFLLPLQFSSNCKLTCYVWSGNQGFIFGDFIKWVLGTWNFRDSVRTQLPPWKCKTLSTNAATTAAAAAAHFDAEAGERQLRGCISSNLETLNRKHEKDTAWTTSPPMNESMILYITLLWC
jgi:hypothetical protein